MALRPAGLVLLAACALLASAAVARAADPPRGGWKGTLKKAVSLADELPAYPVRQDAFRRCLRTLDATRTALEEAGAAADSSSAPELPDRLRVLAADLAQAQKQVRDVVLEFGQGLEISYEGAFSDFSVRAEELAVLLGRVRDSALAAESRFRAGAGTS